MTVDEINIDIISFKILQSINPIRIEQTAGTDHFPEAVQVQKKFAENGSCSFFAHFGAFTCRFHHVDLVIK